MFPILGPESILAAQASYCAARQGKFWPFHERLMARRGTGNRGAYSAPRLHNDAEEIGLDQAAFTQCLKGDESFAYVKKWYDNAVDLGLRGTPTFVVNGVIVASSSLEAVEKAVLRALEGSD